MLVTYDFNPTVTYQIDFLKSIPGLLKRLQIRAQALLNKNRKR
jgi:hypothetical protein